MNITKEQAEEILELLAYVGTETWGKTRDELELRKERIKQVIKEGLADD